MLKFQDKQKVLETIKPIKDIILITGKINVLGVELFCGSIVWSDDDNLEFKPCKPLHPDLPLYTALNNENVQVGDIIQVERVKAKGKAIKHVYNVLKAEPLTDETSLNLMNQTIEEFQQSSKEVLV